MTAVPALVLAPGPAVADPAWPGVAAALAAAGAQPQAMALSGADPVLPPAPVVAVLLPSLQPMLAVARRLRAAWPETHLVLLQPAAALEAFRRAMGHVTLLGRHWSLLESDGPGLALGLQRAVSSARQRGLLRTTLSRANAQLAQPKTVSPAEFERLAVSEQHLANFLRHAREPVLGLDPQQRVLFWSEGAAQLLGVASGQVLGRPVAELGAWGAALAPELAEVPVGPQARTVELLVPLAGEPRALEVVLSGIPGAAGERLGTSIVLRDVTARRRAQERLREANLKLQQIVSEQGAELEKSQLALLQAQKLEAIGKLTGGVAHDFNNVLQIIGSNLQLLEPALQAQPEAERLVRAALLAVDRGAKLSSQLLAFARRQPLHPLPLNVSRRVQEMEQLLRRALGGEVEIETVLSPGLWTTLVDAHQLENVLLNLAINARDAMPQGGRLTLETANVTLDETYADTVPDLAPGQYVMIAVSDTGCGMPPEVVARAFEPFFTTKPEGKGTGLGLSMAYGFAKQSGGHIRIYSEPGAGTTIRIYLPRSYEKEIEVARPAPGPVSGGSETLLVVEDDLAVQAAVVQTLQSLGYRVLRASDAQAALSILQSGMRVDLLFTDVVMPGPLRSPELAQRARALQPGIAVLFTSGYTQNAIVHGGRLDPGVELLSKPYRQEDLARRIRQLLAKRPPAAVAAGSASPAIPAATAGAGRSLRVLLVDDEVELRETSGQLLQLLGCEVVTAASAEDAEAALRSAPADVLLTDLALPGASGMALARTAVALQPGIQVVISSGYGEPLETADLQSRPIRTLPKPYGLEQLQVLLADLRAGRTPG